METITHASATSLARGIRTKQYSSEEVLRAYLQRIEQVNPHINAVVQLPAEAALAEARAKDAALARGEATGPLHGVPFTAKDVFDTAGVITAVGLQERADFVPEQDATVIARMRAAGAILLGKTNCPPGGGGGASDNPVYGRTKNPYNLAHSPGGSSGGEAAIIAAGGSPVGLGSDSGGSLRLPTDFCGIVCLKPTSGRVPNTGAYDHPGGLSDPRTQVGPMARYVEDLGLVLPIIAGVDWRDSGVVPMPLRDPAAVDFAALRMAYYTDDGSATPTPETMQAVEGVARALQSAGITVEEARPEALKRSREITERHWRVADLTGVEVEQLRTDWDRFRTEMLGFMQHYDLILSPADALPAPRHGQEHPLMFNYTLPYSLTGWPCVVVRASISPDGLPIGVQLVARPWREDVALAVGRLIEQASGGWQQSPL
jgi:amidase